MSAAVAALKGGVCEATVTMRLSATLSRAVPGQGVIRSIAVLWRSLDRSISHAVRWALTFSLGTLE